MRSARKHVASLTLAQRAAALMTLLVIIGAIAWIVPFLTREQPGIAGVPGPGSQVPHRYRIEPDARACMNAVSFEPHGDLAAFTVVPARRSARRALRIELVLRAGAYRERVKTAAGYRGGPTTVAITPSPRAAIGNACFVNRSDRTVLLYGTTDPRTVTRSGMVVDGKGAPGSASLTFYDTRTRSLLSKLGDAFAHASNLTDHLMPVTFLWLVAVLTLLMLPVAAIAALYVALREPELTSGQERTNGESAS